jgi:hypothetical protein
VGPPDRHSPLPPLAQLIDPQQNEIFDNQLAIGRNQMSQTIFGYESGTTRGNTLARLTPDDVRIEALSASRWRVSNKCLPPDDRRGLLGFIEQLDDRFEVMELVDGWEDFAWFTFPTLAAAGSHFSDPQPDQSDQEYTVMP